MREVINYSCRLFIHPIYIAYINFIVYSWPRYIVKAYHVIKLGLFWESVANLNTSTVTEKVLEHILWGWDNLLQIQNHCFELQMFQILKLQNFSNAKTFQNSNFENLKYIPYLALLYIWRKIELLSSTIILIACTSTLY